VSESPPRSLSLRVAFGACIVLYAALLLPTLTRHGIGWDEQTDLGVAVTYGSEPGGWLRGSDVDAINVRLPMAVSAALFAAIGNPDLLAARALSGFLGALTLLAVYLFGRREFDGRKAVLACALLATSPYFLAYMRTAFSEGDAFVTCALAWLLFCLSRLRHTRSLGWATATAVVLGAAFASKISAVAALPVVWVTLLLPARDESPAPESLPARGWRTLTWLLAALYVAIFAGWEIAKRVEGEPSLVFLASHAGIVTAIWGALLIAAAGHGSVRLSNGRLTAFVTLLGALTFFVLPPMHTTNVDIVNQLVGAFLFSNVISPASFAFEAAALHASVIAFKPGLVIGLAMWASVIAALFSVRARPALRIPLLFLACYVAFLLRLPWAQTFYMMPALPVLAIMLADRAIEIFDRKRWIAIALGAVAVISLGMDFSRGYPDLHLNGYQWLGARPWGGRPSLGARSVVPVPTDGAEQALRFVDAHAAPGDVVVIYVRPAHIRDALISHPPYFVIDGLTDPHAIARADWVVTTLGAELNHGYGADDPTSVFALPYDPDLLARRFEPVLRIDRAFDLEIAAVWRANVGGRVSPGEAPATK